MKPNEWRAYGSVKAADVAEAIKSFESRTGKKPVRALISQDGSPEIAAAVQAIVPNVKRDKSLLPFDLWLADTEEQQADGQQGLF